MNNNMNNNMNNIMLYIYLYVLKHNVPISYNSKGNTVEFGCSLNMNNYIDIKVVLSDQ